MQAENPEARSTVHGECGICLFLIEGHVMSCQHCSMILCVDCQTRSGHRVCPQCQHIDKFVRSRPMEMVIESLRAERADFCHAHQTEKRYLCTTCNESLCPDCFFDGHMGHKKKNLVSEYKEASKRIRTEMDGFDQVIDKFRSEDKSLTQKKTNNREQVVAQKEEIVTFSEMLEISLDTEATRMQDRINEWQENQIQVPLAQVTSSKERVEKKIKSDFKFTLFVEEATIVDSIQKACSLRVPIFQEDQEKDSEWVKGTFVFENFLGRRKNVDCVRSDPFVVENNVYQLKFQPIGESDGQNTYISVGIRRVSLSCLKSSDSTKVTSRIILLHPSDSAKDKIREDTDDWTGKPNYAFMFTRFCATYDLHRNGFIHKDGSLRFEFFVKKHNYCQRLEAAEEKLRASYVMIAKSEKKLKRVKRLKGLKKSLII